MKQRTDSQELTILFCIKPYTTNISKYQEIKNEQSQTKGK